MTHFEAFNKAFDHAQTESKLKNYWQTHNFYKSTRNPNKKPYTIVMPPPNITGNLTMGHMMYSLQDLLIRWHRAKGYEACWIPGTDHASIATEAKVTKMLTDKGISKQGIGREKFLQYAFEWKDKYGHIIEDQLQSLGISCDWSRNTFTMGEKYSAAVIKAIVKLYKDGLVYRNYKLVNWCPVSQSVISDEEVLPEERDGSLWHIRYIFEDDPNHSITVATTRPETLFGDQAVAVNPTDERYKKYIGKNVIIPICNRKIPIIADNYVEKDFGSGVLKITPAHDMNDFEIGKRHNLEPLNIMQPNAHLNDKVPEKYRGLDRFIARQNLVAELKENNLLEKITSHKLVIGISERGNVPIEYYLSEQWYIKMDSLAQMALDATRSKKLKLIPPHQEKVWEHWLSNIHDWCISRQLWWGHRMPMYYCKKCNHIHCAETAPLQCEKCACTELKQDEDALDTWASSWLWPFAVHNWANPSEEEKKDLAYYYPTDIIITASDIIFFWIARMVMAGEYFTNTTPFHSCYFTPVIRDSIGRKMSKSLGNSPDVQGIMEKYGTDAMRFSLINQIVSGQDILWKDECCELGKMFANKLWNATRFLSIYVEKYNVNTDLFSFDLLTEKNNDPVMGWIISEFYDLLGKVHSHVKNCEFSQYSSSMYEFVWMIFCDWFVELMKPRFSQENNEVIARETITFAMQIFDGVLRLLHPIIPFITEEIWLTLNPKHQGKTLGFEVIPDPKPEMINSDSIQKMRSIQQIVSAVRTIRGKFNIHPGTELTVYLSDVEEKFGILVPQMESLAKAKFQFASQQHGFCAPTVVNNSEIYVSLEGLVDKKAEEERLLKKIAKVVQTINGIEKKLSNNEFVSQAPAHIIAGAKKQLEENKLEEKVLLDSLELLK